MATATAISGAATSTAGIAGGVAKFFEGRKMQRQAQNFINNFEWQDLDNPYEELEVSTMSADLQREEAARMSATNVDAIRAGGNRALANIGKVQAQNNLMNREIGANLDQQQKTINFSKAQDDVRIRQMIEQRQADELAGYGTMLNQGLGMKYQGIGNIVNGLGSMTQSISGGITGGATGGVSAPASTLASQGVHSAPVQINPTLATPSINGGALMNIGGIGMLEQPNSASLNYGNPYNV